MEASPYMKFGLKFNPFPRGEAEQYRDKPEKLEVFLFEAEKNKLHNFSKEISFTSVSFVVLGSWGTGKTLFLLYFYKLLRKLYGRDKVELIYIKAPRNSSEIINRIYNYFINKKLVKRETRRSLSEEEKINNIANTIEKLAEEEQIVYIAIDQLEEVFRYARYSLKPEESASELLRLAETLRGRLSAIASKRYAMGISCIDVEWYDFSESWPSLKGLEQLRLRPLQRHEVPEFVYKYLETARDKDFIEASPELSKHIQDNPYYPFTLEALEVLWNYSAGVQRYICSWAGTALEEVSAEKQVMNIDADIIRLVVDPRYEIYYTAYNDIYPYHHTRLMPLLREILAWIESTYPDLGVYYIGPSNNALLVMVKDKILALINYSRPLTKNDIPYIDKILSEGLDIEGEKVKPDKVMILIWVPRSIPASKIMDTVVKLYILKHRDKILVKKLDRDTYHVWGRLAAYYAMIMGMLPLYLVTDKEKRKEAEELLKLLGLII